MSDPPPEIVPGQATRPAFRAFMHMTSSKAVSTGLLFVAFAITAAALGPAGLGIYAFGIATFGIFAYVSDFGFQEIVRRDVAQSPAREAEFLPNLVYLRMVMAVLSYGFMIGILTLLGYSASEREAAMVTGVLLLVLAAEPARIPLELRLRLGWVAGVEAFEAVALAAGSVVLLAAHSGPIAFLWLYVGANALTVLLLVPAALRLTTLRWRPHFGVVTSIGRVAWPVGLVNLITTIYYGIDTLILARFHSTNAVGQYGAAYRVLSALGLFTGVVISIVTPLLARSSAEDRAVLQRRVSLIARFLLAAAVPIAIGGAMTAWRAFTKVPGFGSYHSGGIAFSILAPAAGFIFLATLAQVVLIVDHRERILIGVSIASLVITLALCFALIPPYSLIGAAVATTITEAVGLLVSWWMLRRHVGVSLFDERARRMLGPALVLVVVLIPCYLVAPLLQVAIGGLVYLVSLPLFKAVTWRDLEGFGDQDGPVVILPVIPSASVEALAIANQMSATQPIRLIMPWESQDPASLRQSIDLRIPTDSNLSTLRGELKGASVCRLVGDAAEAGPRMAVAARLAGCPSVVIDPWSQATRRTHPVRRWIWGLVVDQAQRR